MATESDDPESTSPVIGDIDLFVTIGLLFLCLVSHLKRRFLIPASGVLIMFGIAINAVGRSVQDYSGKFDIDRDAEKEIIELVFLPTLITECALSLDWHLFLRQIWQILLLAIPSVIFSSILTAVVIRDVMGYTNEWYGALVMGAVFSATDHVSVVAILKDVKADENLMTLMQGETLVNDGTVFVIFTFAMKDCIGKTCTAEEMTEFIFRQSLGGIGLGVAFSLAVSVWLYYIVNEAIVESLLTLLSSYLLFYTSTLVKVSGALGSVVYGLYMSAYGRLFISPKSEKSFRFLWKTLRTAFEALLLLMCGSLIGGFIFDKDSLTTRDIYMMFIFFLLQYLIRAATILFHWPLIWFFDLKMDGKEFKLSKIDYKKMLVLIFGGLKGTMSISLALIFQQVESSEQQPEKILFWAVGITGLSNTVGSLILFVLVRCLGMEDLSLYDHSLLVSFEEQLRNDTILRFEEETGKKEFERVLRTQAKEGLMDEKFYRYLKTNFRKLKREKDNFEDVKESLSVPLWEQDKIIYLRKLFFRMVKGVYFESFEHHSCYRGSYFLLLDSANYGIDKRLCKMRDWKFLEYQLLPKRTMNFLTKLSSKRFIGHFFSKIRYYFIAIAYDTANNYIKSRAETMKRLMRVLDKKVFNKNITSTFESELQKQTNKAKRFLSAQTQCAEFQALTELVQTHQVRLMLCYYRLNRIQSEFRHGTLGKLQHSIAFRWFDNRITEEERRMLLADQGEKNYLRQSYLFEDMSEKRFCELTEGYEVIHFEENSANTQERLHEGLLLVIKGKLAIENLSIDFLEEEFVGIEAALKKLDYTLDWQRGTVVAETAASCVYLNKALVDRYLEQEDMLKRMCVLMVEHAVRNDPKRFGELGDLNAIELRTILHGSELRRHLPEDQIPRNRGFILVCGSLVSGLSAPAYCPRDTNHSEKAEDQAITLHFMEIMSKLEPNIATAVREYRASIESLDEDSIKEETRESSGWGKEMEDSIK